MAFAILNDGLNSGAEASGTGVSMTLDVLVDSLSSIMPCRVTNTLILTFWALSSTRATDDIGRELLRSAFEVNSDLTYLVWVCPAGAAPPPFLHQMFSKINLERRNSAVASSSSSVGDGGAAAAAAAVSADPLKGCAVYVLHRSKICPALQVREARVEDSDDLLPIVLTCNRGPSLSSSGSSTGAGTGAGDAARDDFFLTDLIQAQDDSNKLFVGVNSKSKSNKYKHKN